MAEQSVLRSANTSIYQSPSIPSHLNKTGPSIRPQKPPSLRPLTAAYNAAASEHTVMLIYILFYCLNDIHKRRRLGSRVYCSYIDG